MANQTVTELSNVNGVITYSANKDMEINSFVTDGKVVITTPKDLVIKDVLSVGKDLDISSNDVLINAQMNTNGNIQINSTNNYTQNADITSDNGNIILNVTNDINQNADILAKGGNVTLSSVSGGIIMANQTVTELSNVNGVITYSANKDIRISEIISNNLIKLKSNGSIIDNKTDESSNIKAKDLIVNSSLGFGLISDDINTDIETITVTNVTNGGVYFSEIDDLSIKTINANNQIVSIKSKGLISDGTSFEDINIVSDKLFIFSSNGIGTLNDDLDLNINTLENATVDVGNIVLSNDKSIEIGKIQSSNIVQLDINGSIVDSLVTEEANIVSNILNIMSKNGVGSVFDDIDTNVTILNINNSINGNIVIEEKDALDIGTIFQNSGNMIISNNQDDITLVQNMISDDGFVSLHSSKDFIQNGNISLLSNGQTLEVFAQGSIKMALNTVTYTNGNVRYFATNEILIEYINSNSADVSLKAETINGSIKNSVNVKSNSLRIEAQTIGTVFNPLKTDINILNSINGEGGLYLEEINGLNIIFSEDIVVNTISSFITDSAINGLISNNANISITVDNGNLNIDKLEAKNKIVNLNVLNGSIMDISGNDSVNIKTEILNINVDNNVDIHLDIDILNANVYKASSVIFEDIDSIKIGIIDAPLAEVTLIVAPNGNFTDLYNDDLINITATHLRLIGHGISSTEDNILNQAIETKAKTISLGSYVTNNAVFRLNIEKVVIGKLQEDKDVWTQFVNLGVMLPMSTNIASFEPTAYNVSNIDMVYLDYGLLRYLMKRTYFIATNHSLASINTNNFSLGFNLPTFDSNILDISNKLYDTFISLGGDKILIDDNSQNKETNKDEVVTIVAAEEKLLRNLSSIPEFGTLTFDQSIIQNGYLNIPFEYWIENITL